MSRADYDKARQDAMMAAMTWGASSNSNRPTEAVPASEGKPANTPDNQNLPNAGDVVETATKGVDKQKVRKKFKLPF